MEKNCYSKPKIDIIEFDKLDLLCASGDIFIEDIDIFIKDSDIFFAQ